MYKDEPAGFFNYGYIEDLDEINSKNLYEYYQDLKKKCKIDIFVSGKVEMEETLKIINDFIILILILCSISNR